MAKVQLQAKILQVEQLKNNVFKFQVDAKKITDQAKPGNFIEVRVTDTFDPFLRRPISIYNMDKQKGTLEFIFQVKGKGTDLLSKKQVGDQIDIVGPLGFGTFDYSKYQNLGIIGGGIGVFPLYELAKQAKQDGKNVNTYLGYRSKEFVLLEEEFKNVSNEFCLATDDGTYGKSGFAINFLKQDIEDGKIDSIYACGPLPMLRAVKSLAIEKNIPCQVSLEERMGCGIGVCLGCSVKIAKSPKENPEYVGVCKVGPVFDANYVEF